LIFQEQQRSLRPTIRRVVLDVLLSELGQITSAHRFGLSDVFVSSLVLRSDVFV